MEAVFPFTLGLPLNAIIFISTPYLKNNNVISTIINAELSNIVSDILQGTETR
jgi:hypothetical protein